MLADSFNSTESPEPDTSDQAVSVRHSIVLALLRSDQHSDWDNVIFQAKHLAAFVLRGEVSAGDDGLNKAVAPSASFSRTRDPISEGKAWARRMALFPEHEKLSHVSEPREPAVPDDGLNKAGGLIRQPAIIAGRKMVCAMCLQDAPCDCGGHGLAWVPVNGPTAEAREALFVCTTCGDDWESPRCTHDDEFIDRATGSVHRGCEKIGGTD